jgi:hypothetical protein
VVSKVTQNSSLGSVVKMGLTDGSRNGDPAEFTVQLEWKDQDVDPCDLRNSNTICEWERGAKDSFGSSQGIVHSINCGN